MNPIWILPAAVMLAGGGALCVLVAQVRGQAKAIRTGLDAFMIDAATPAINIAVEIIEIKKRGASDG